MVDIVRTGIGLSKTIRNVSRLREIVIVFAKHGFDEFITKNVTSLIPGFVLPKSTRGIRSELEENQIRDWNQIIGRRLKFCFEELGPSFIKFGQLLSSREDLFEQSFIDEMKSLRDKVKPLTFDELKDEMEKSLGKKLDEVFSEVEPGPIGMASIGIVFKGKLKSGESVVIKVRRPGIKKLVETDFSILSFLASQMEKVSEELRFLGISRIVDDLGSSLVNELNFNIEALNCERFEKIIQKYDKKKSIVFPKIYKEFSSSSLLVMEYFEGTPFTNNIEVKEKCENLAEILAEDLQIFLKAFLKDGFFHADLHAGNIFLLDDNKIGLIDFGLMGTLSRRSRVNFVAIVYAIINFNYENLVYEFLDVAEYDTIPDIDHLVHDVRVALNPYVGLTAQQTDFSEVLKITLTTLRKHEIYLPRDWYTIFRSFITLDGLGRALGFDFDVFSMLEEDIYQVMQESFNKEELIEEGLWTARDFLTFSRALPRHIKWYLKDWSRNGYAHKLILSGHESHLNNINQSLKFLGFIILGSVFIACGTILLPEAPILSFSELPPVVIIFWLFGLISIVLSVINIRKSS